MAIEYLGLSEINGPLVVLEGVKNASYEEIVSFRMDDGTEKELTMMQKWPVRRERPYKKKEGFRWYREYVPWKHSYTS